MPSCLFSLMRFTLLTSSTILFFIFGLTNKNASLRERKWRERGVDCHDDNDDADRDVTVMCVAWILDSDGGFSRI